MFPTVLAPGGCRSLSPERDCKHVPHVLAAAGVRPVWYPPSHGLQPVLGALFGSAGSLSGNPQAKIQNRYFLSSYMAIGLHTHPEV